MNRPIKQSKEFYARERTAPHGRGGPTDDVIGQVIIGLRVDEGGKLTIALTNGMDIFGREESFEVEDANVVYPLSKWKEIT